MIDVIDILNKKQKKIKLNRLIILKKKSLDYILSIPHSGILIPVEFQHKLNMEKSLILGTDLFTEQLYKISQGVTIISNLSRYLVNMNRYRKGSKNKSLPKHLQKDPLHGTSLTNHKVLIKNYSKKEKEKILKFYDQYHSFLEETIQEMKQKQGYALILDCHSMNSTGLKNTPDEGEERSDFTIGTLEGNSAHPDIINSFYETLKKESKKINFTVKKDYPYKGGFITRHYGKPSEDVHVIQLEVKKSNYMYEGLDGSTDKRFKLKKDGLKKINSIISKTMKITSKKAKKIYTQKV